MKHLRILASVSTAISAVILALLPIFVAIDYGGVLWWTQYVAGLAIVAAFVLALPSLADWHRYTRPRQLLVIVPLLFWLLYSAFQAVSLPPSLVATLSPGSHAAYTQWLEPILPASQLPTSFPISISQDDTAHAVANFGILFVLTWTSLRVFNTRARLIGLLSCVAITGAMVSVLGVVGLMLPEIPFFAGFDSHFSTFVNRNNAALAMNLGLAASLGLLSWRLSALTGQELDGEEFEFNDLYALTSDRDSAIGMFSALLCVTGLLICGSRAGLATILFAALLSLGWIRKRKGFSTIPVVFIATTILAGLLTVPLQLNLESIRRMEFFSDSSETILNDGRFNHWPEGWQTALNHLPCGSGLSTYGYAYLPNQVEIPKNWFVHADNLWLELLVEQGFFGIGFTLCLFAVLIWCLHRMSHSHDALDHGLRVTGWYSIGAILFSQCFDFGFIIPANLLLSIPILAAVVTRSVESDLLPSDESTERPSYWAGTRSGNWFAIRRFGLQVFGLVAVLFAATISINALHGGAVADSLSRTADMHLASPDPTISLDDLRNELQSANQYQANPKLLNSLAKTEHRLGRVAEVAAVGPKSASEAQAIFASTAPSVRRLAGCNPATFVNKFPAELSMLDQGNVPNQYIKAVDHYQLLLTQVPLSRQAREGLLYLDFASKDGQENGQPTLTAALLNQLGELYRASPRQLLAIANLAAQSQFNKTAVAYWKSAIDQSPMLTVSAMNKIKNYKSVELLDALPSNPDSMHRAVKRIVQLKDEVYASSLPKMVPHLECDKCEQTDEKAKCLNLAALALVFANQLEESFSFFKQAIELRPSNASTRLQYIDALRKMGRKQDALTQARQGRQISPNDARFDAIIRKMAIEEISNQ